jgi:acetate kinase
VDEALMEEMERVTPFAPAHNPIYLNAMRNIRKQFPELKQVARFETSFHGTIPEKRVTYGVPYAWKEELGIRRYGFHGSSHQYIAQTVARLQPGARRIINCHLGGSSSICAILDGKSIATSMGATLQVGLFNNNRVGDFEVFCMKPVMDHYGYSLDELLEILSKKSGLLGLSGVSNDLRLVLEAADGGNAQAKLAFETLADNILGYIGMYAAYLNGLDALVFTGGIGTNSAVLRKTVCDGLGYLGLSLDEEKNEGRGDGCVSTDDSRVKVWRLKTDEESVVAGCVREFLHEKA